MQVAAARDRGNGYRQFDTAALARLRFIATARGLGFSLKAIAAQLAQADAGRSPCPGVRELLEHRLASLAAQRRALAREEARLRAVRTRWRQLPDGTPDGQRLCPLLDALASTPGMRRGEGVA